MGAGSQRIHDMATKTRMTRVLAHAHTNWSHDSSLTVEDWIDIARERKCDAVLLTEHEETGWTADRYRDYVTACAEASTSAVRIMPGLELNHDGFHVLCYGLQHFRGRPNTLSELIRWVNDQGCWLSLAHPGKYRWRYPQELLDAVEAVEVWNSKWIYDGPVGPHPATMAIAAGKRWLVGQDAHKRAHLSDLYLETTTRDILRDLREGRYRILMSARAWTPAELSSRVVAPVAQQIRTTALRTGLPALRWTRRKLRLVTHHSPPVLVKRG
jgi:hypothetical protein